MILEVASTNVLDEVAKANKEVRKKELEELPKEIGKASEVNSLPDEIGEKLKNNSTYEINGCHYETDDNGKIYKIDEKLTPNTTYTIKGTKFKTDANGQITNWEGCPHYNPDGERDNVAQKEVGGLNRKSGDDGGHLVGRILGGSPGIENLVPMRDTINRGDYKKAENEMEEALKNGKEVHVEGSITREGNDSRPTKIEVKYSYDDTNKVLTVDNVEKSQDLLKNVEGKISDKDYESLLSEVNEMTVDGCEVSVTSVLEELDKNGNVKSVTVGVRDEVSKDKSYRTFNGV